MLQYLTRIDVHIFMKRRTENQAKHVSCCFFIFRTYEITNLIIEQPFLEITDLNFTGVVIQCQSQKMQVRFFRRYITVHF